MNRLFVAIVSLITLGAVVLGAVYLSDGCTSTMVVMANVVTEPAGAIVSVNERQVEGLTPIRNVALELTQAKDITVTVKKAGYTAWQQVMKPGDLAHLDKTPITLMPIEPVVSPEVSTQSPPIKLSVTSTPLGASVSIDGTVVGRTPLSDFEIEAEGADVAVSLSARGYQTQTVTRRRIDLKNQSAISMSLSLELPRLEEATPRVPGPDRATPAPPPPPGRTAMKVLIVSNPIGASVLKDGASMGTTPCQIEIPPGKKVNVEVSLAGFKANRRQITWVEAGLPGPESFDLVEVDPLEVEVSTEPAGANLTIDGILKGKSPQRVSVRWGKPVKVTASLEGYGDSKAEIVYEVVMKTKKVKLKLTPLPKVKLTVKSTPPGATVTIDGIAWGTTPVKEKPVSKTGTVRIQIAAPGYESWVTEADLARLGDNHLIEATLQRQPLVKTVTISSVPPGAKVQLDGRDIGVTPLSTGLQIRDAEILTLSFNLPGYLAVTQKFGRQELATTTTVSITLEKPAQDPKQCGGPQAEDWLARATTQKLDRATMVALRDCFIKTKNWQAVLTLTNRILEDPIWASSGVDHYARALGYLHGARKPDDYLACAEDAEVAYNNRSSLSKCDIIWVQHTRSSCLQRYLTRVAQLDGSDIEDELESSLRQLQNSLLSEDLGSLPERERQCFSDVQKAMGPIEEFVSKNR